MKKIVLLLTILILFTGCKEKENAFKKLGYNDKEIKVINTLSKPKKVLNYKYDKNIISLIKNTSFKEENLDKYINLGKKTNLNNDDIMFIVNSGYDSDKIVYDQNVLNLMKEKYFVFSNLDRYLAYQKDDMELKTVIRNVNANLDYDYYTNIKDADLTKDKLVLVNKYYKLKEDYVPDNLVDIESMYGTGKLDKDVYEAYKLMYLAAIKDQKLLYIRSPYRSYSVQNSLYERYARSDGYSRADTYSARPGHSEHQTGLAFDVTSLTSDLGGFENTPEFTWLKENSYKYGFILRYPEGKEDITGYIYEPWHYRYVGKDVALKIHDEDITFEEYYEYYVK